MTVPDEIRVHTAAYLRELAPVPRVTLLSLCGITGKTSGADVSSLVDDALRSPEAAAKAIASLPEPSVRLLCRWILRGPHAVRSSWSGSRQGRTEPLDDTQLRAASAPLEEKGLIADLSGHVVVLPPLARALRAAAAEQALAGVRAGDARPPYPFFLAIVAGVVAHEAPALTQSGELHARSMQRVEKRLGGAFLFGLSVAFGLQVLRRLGALVRRRSGESVTLGVDAERLKQALGGDPEAIALASVAVTEGTSGHLRTLVQLRAAAPAKASSDGATLDEIERAITPPERRGSDFDADPLDAFEIATHLGNLRAKGLVRVASAGPPTRLAAATPPAHGAARWVVQPSFDILAAWDVAPARVALLGCFADLEQPDRVCRFRLSPESVARGAAALGEPSPIVAVLEEGAAGPLPPNVRTTVVGWLARGRPLRPVLGPVVVAADDEQRQLLRTLPDAVEVTPDVYSIPESALAALAAAAKKRGITLAPAIGAGRDRPDWREARVPSVDEAAGEARERLAEIEKARSAPPRPSKKPPSAGSSTRAAVGELRGLVDTILKRREGGRPGDEDLDERDPDDDVMDVDPDDEARQRLDRLATRASELARSRGAASPPAAGKRPADDDDEPRAWESPLLGALRQILVAAIRDSSPLGLIALNGRDVAVERDVVPVRLRTMADREELVARDATSGEACVFPLDRITAIRR